MKYAQSVLRMEEHRLSINLEELRLKKEEIPVTTATQPQREHLQHLHDLSIAHLDETRKALKFLENGNMGTIK